MYTLSGLRRRKVKRGFTTSSLSFVSLGLICWFCVVEFDVDVPRVRDAAKSVKMGIALEQVPVQFVAWENETRITSLTIAVASCTTSKGSHALTNLRLTKFLNSILKTLETEYLYEFHVCVQVDDQFYRNLDNQMNIAKLIEPHPLHFHALTWKNPQVPLRELLIRAQRDYIVDYIVGVYDDTEFLTTGWTTLGVNSLLNNRPANTGIVAPTVRGPVDVEGCSLSHGMVHRTHFEIFPSYHSPLLDDECMDEFVRRVYAPAYANRIKEWIVVRKSHQYRARCSAQMIAEPSLLDQELSQGLKTFYSWLWKERQVSDSWAVVLTVSDGFDDMFKNWYSWFKNLKLHLEVIIIAKDHATFWRYSSLTGVTTVLSPRMSNTDNVTAHAYESKEYKSLVSTRAADILYALQYRSNVLYTDTDTVWLKDPTSFLRGDFDFAGGLDAWKNNLPYYCTGFLALKNTSKTRALLIKWNMALTQNPQLNQPIFNDLLYEHVPSIRHRPLSRTHFPSGDLYFDHGYKQLAVVVHNNYIIGVDSKVQRFKSNGLWFAAQSLALGRSEDDGLSQFDEECTHR
jgi:hypothetical protein